MALLDRMLSYVFLKKIIILFLFFFCCDGAVEVAVAAVRAAWDNLSPP